MIIINKTLFSLNCPTWKSYLVELTWVIIVLHLTVAEAARRDFKKKKKSNIGYWSVDEADSKNFFLISEVEIVAFLGVKLKMCLMRS